MKIGIIFSLIILFSNISLAQPPDPKVKVVTEPTPFIYEPPPPPQYEQTNLIPKIETVVDTLASFPGGKKELLKFLEENIEFPDDMRNICIRGKVVVKFVVTKEGSIMNVTIVRGIKEYRTPTCDAEAIRVVKIMPKWIPAKKNGEIVNSYFHLPIDFGYQ